MSDTPDPIYIHHHTERVRKYEPGEIDPMKESDKDQRIKEQSQRIAELEAEVVSLKKKLYDIAGGET